MFTVCLCTVVSVRGLWVPVRRHNVDVIVHRVIGSRATAAILAPVDELMY